MKAVLTSSLIGVSMILLAMLHAQNRPPAPTMVGAKVPPWAEVTVAPGLTIVVARDEAPPADQLIVRTFYWQDIKGISKPVLRSIVDVVGFVRNVAIGANGAPDPSRVQSVHIDAVTVLTRFEWTSPPTQAAPAPVPPHVQPQPTAQ